MQNLQAIPIAIKGVEVKLKTPVLADVSQRGEPQVAQAFSAIFELAGLVLESPSSGNSLLFDQQKGDAKPVEARSISENGDETPDLGDLSEILILPDQDLSPEDFLMFRQANARHDFEDTDEVAQNTAEPTLEKRPQIDLEEVNQPFPVPPVLQKSVAVTPDVKAINPPDKLPTGRLGYGAAKFVDNHSDPVSTPGAQPARFRTEYFSPVQAGIVKQHGDPDQNTAGPVFQPVQPTREPPSGTIEKIENPAVGPFRDAMSTSAKESTVPLRGPVSQDDRNVQPPNTPETALKAEPGKISASPEALAGAAPPAGPYLANRFTDAPVLSARGTVSPAVSPARRTVPADVFDDTRPALVQAPSDAGPVAPIRGIGGPIGSGQKPDQGRDIEPETNSMPVAKTTLTNHSGAPKDQAPTGLLIQTPAHLSKVADGDNFLSSDIVASQSTEKSHAAMLHSAITPSKADFAGHVPRQLAEVIHSNHGKTLDISLRPEELGRVKLSIVSSDNGIAVNILAERPETLDLIRRNIDQLNQELRQLGYQNTGFSFDREGKAPQPKLDTTLQSDTAPTDNGPEIAAPTYALERRDTGTQSGLDVRV